MKKQKSSKFHPVSQYLIASTQDASSDSLVSNLPWLVITRCCLLSRSWSPPNATTSQSSRRCKLFNVPSKHLLTDWLINWCTEWMNSDWLHDGQIHAELYNISNSQPSQANPGCLHWPAYLKLQTALNSVVHSHFPCFKWWCLSPLTYGIFCLPISPFRI